MAKAVCGAKTRAGGRCTVAPMPNGKCYMHGGATPAPGPGHPNYEHGRYSKIYRLPQRMAPRFERAMNDPELTDTTRDLALVQTLLDDQLGQLTDGDPVAALQRIREHWDAIEAEKQKPDRDVEVIRSHMESLGKAIEGIRPDYPTHRELINHAKTRATLAEKHQSLMMDRALLFTVSQVRDMLQRVHERFDGIIGQHLPSHANDARRKLGEHVRSIILGISGRDVRSDGTVDADSGDAVLVAGNPE